MSNTINKNEVYWLEQIANNMPSGMGIPAMTVEGTWGNYSFVPNEGQPTHAQAVAHYLAGGTVLLKVEFNYDEGSQYYTGLVVGHYSSNGVLVFVLPDNLSTSGGTCKTYFWNAPAQG